MALTHGSLTVSAVYYGSLPVQKIYAGSVEVWSASGGNTLTAGTGAFSLAGQDALLKRTLVLETASGSVVLTGNDANLTVVANGEMVAGTGNFVLTGANASLLRSLLILGSPRSFALVGGDAAFHLGKMLAAGAGSFALNGQAASFLRSLRLDAVAGSYALTGRAAALTYNGGAALSYAFTGYYSSLANGNPSFASVDFGAAPTGSNTRHILVMKGRTSAGTSSQPVSTAVSIGGVSATLINSQSINFGCIEAWIAEVPSGASGTVAFTSGGSRHGLAVYKITNLSSIGAITSAIASSGSVSLSMLASQVAIAGYAATLTTAPTMTGVSENANDSPGTSSRFVMGSDMQSGDGTVTVDVTGGSATRAIMMVGVS